MIRTERLILRPWEDRDLAPYAAANADPRVREFYPALLTKEESDAEVRRLQQRFAAEGFCMFAAELVATGAFIGCIGMQTMPFAVPSLPQPAVEIGWRLAHSYWGMGLATEGARAVLDYAFNTVRLKHVVAVTTVANLRSRHVMEKLGMAYQPEFDFEHPSVPENNPLRRHVLYSINAS